MSAPPPGGPSLRTTILATAAAVGVVTTGTFTAAALSPGSRANTASAADGPPLTAALAARTALLTRPGATAVGALAPVTFAQDNTFAAADQHLAGLGKASDLAVKLAEQHAQEQRAQAERDRVDAIVAQGGLDGWVAEALRTLELPQSLAPGIKKIIMQESGGNPRAVNNWDANARRGTPSQGLMQTIPSTFRHYVAPQLADRSIFDPVANITAGVRYMIENYGIGTLQAGGRTNGYGGYVGY